MAKLIFYSGPAFLVAVGFMDPGKWVTIIEGGSRFGYELLWVVVFSTILAILLQSISARLGVITGKHLAQVFREEYPWAVCVVLWVLCEISIIIFDLTMVLGTAIGLNAVLQMPMHLSLFLTTLDSLLFIVILPLMEIERSEGATIIVTGIVLLCCLLESTFSMSVPSATVMGFWPKLRHETLYTMISIVGANIMPHNFYLHSALVKGQSNQSLSTLSHYNFLGNLFAVSAVLVVNLAVLMVSVTGFHNGGLVVLTLQDVQVLIEQILNNSVFPASFGLALLCVGQLSTLNGSRAGQVVLETFLDFKIRPWQHWVWIRAVALVPAATCVWRYGNDGTYRILIFSQVLLALNLPFTVAPLIKITSSERIMGSQKNSLLLETLAWLSIILMSVVNLTLIFDLVFGESEDDSSFGGLQNLADFEWFVEIVGENFQTTIFATISLGTSLSLGFLIWLIFTPLQVDTGLSARSLWMEDYSKQDEADFTQLTLGSKSATSDIPDDSLVLKLTVQGTRSEKTVLEGSSLIASPYNGSLLLSKATDEAEGNSSALPVKVQEFSGQQLQLDNCQNKSSEDPLSSPGSLSTVPSPLDTFPDLSTSTTPRKPNAEVSVVDNQQTVAIKEVEVEADAEVLGKEDDEYDSWESLEKDALVNIPRPIVNTSNCSLQCGDFEFRKSGRTDTSLGGEGDSGSGSLSKLSGLGRAARRQFAFILDEFWASLFDLHGLPLSTESQSNLDATRSCTIDGALSVGGSSCEEKDGQKSNSKLKPSWKKLRTISDQVHNMESYVFCTHRRALTSTASRLSAAGCPEFGPSSSHRFEQRCSGMQRPHYHENYDGQPATFHGYRTQFPERPVSTAASFNSKPLHVDFSLNGSGIARGHGQEVDDDVMSPGVEHENAFDSTGLPLLSGQWTSHTLGDRFTIDFKGDAWLSTQKEKHMGLSESSSYDPLQWDRLVDQTRNSTLRKWNPLVYRATGELDMNNTPDISEAINKRASINQSPIGRCVEGDQFERGPLVFDELSPSQTHRDGFSIRTVTSRPETQSLWSRQPFEQLFGTTNVTGRTSQLPRCNSSSQLVQSSCSSSSLSDGAGVELKVLGDLQVCVGKLLQLDGADWLFRVDSGADEDLITAIAAMQVCLMEIEKSELCILSGNRVGEKYGMSRSSKGNDGLQPSQRQRDGIPNCGKGCVWSGSLLVSFGMWCVHRVLELCLMESRPELWGKYTYVLNRLQGILEPAFAKTRIVPLCRCLNDLIVVDHAKHKTLRRQGTKQEHCRGDVGSSSPEGYSHTWPLRQNTSASASTFLDMIKDVEAAVGSRKGRTGTTAGDVAFPRGKENLASVLKRYKRRLASNPPGSTVVGSRGRRLSLGFPHSLLLAAIVSVG